MRKDRIKRIHDVIPMVQVLADLGYHVNPNGAHREQQFSCNLHGDGRDGKPSARVYPDSNSWYCFACNKARDAIDTYQAVKRLSFPAAVKALEREYKLPDLPWDDEDEGQDVLGPEPVKAPPTLIAELEERLNRRQTFPDVLQSVTRTLTWVTQERIITMHKAVSFWAVLDLIQVKVTEGLAPPEKGCEVLQDVLSRIDVLLQEATFEPGFHRGQSHHP